MGNQEERKGGTRIAGSHIDMCTPSHPDPGRKKGLRKNRARATVKNYLIETPMSKCNNKQKYTCINMYI